MQGIVFECAFWFCSRSLRVREPLRFVIYPRTSSAPFRQCPPAAGTAAPPKKLCACVCVCVARRSCEGLVRRGVWGEGGCKGRHAHTNTNTHASAHVLVVCPSLRCGSVGRQCGAVRCCHFEAKVSISPARRYQMKCFAYRAGDARPRGDRTKQTHTHTHIYSPAPASRHFRT